MSLYSDGHFCFTCSKSFPLTYNDDLCSFQYIDYRSVKASTYEKYKVVFKIAPDGTPIEMAYPYGAGEEPAYKVRRLLKKEFYSKGSMKDAGLFGADVFPAGSSDSIVITEGELDAISVHQMLGKPAVSIRGASSAFADCSRSLDYLNSFNRVYLAFDNDTAGRLALAKVSSLFDNGKVYHLKITGKYKDANDFLTDGAIEEFKNVFFYSRRFLPSEVISSYADIKAILEEEKQKELITYPFAELQRMTYGIRTGEIVLITAQEGLGKTEIARAIEAHCLRTTDLNLGIIHLEESKQRSVQGLAGYELRAPVHLPDASYSVVDVFTAYRNITKHDERVHLINHFDNDDPKAALELIRFLVVKCNCRLIVLDHITLLVTGRDDEDERKSLDYLSTKLEKMVEELDFALIMISHVNDEGKTRGSRNVSKVASIRIDLTRDHLALSEADRNTTYLTVSKNRFGSRTGPAGLLTFDPETFIVSERKETDGLIPSNV